MIGCVVCAALYMYVFSLVVCAAWCISVSRLVVLYVQLCVSTCLDWLCSVCKMFMFILVAMSV